MPVFIGLVYFYSAGKRSVKVPGPADANVFDQGVGAVLCEEHDVKNPGVDAITQGEIYDTVLSGKKHGRFCSFDSEYT